MKLYIDTSDSDKIIIGFDEKRFEKDLEQRRSQILLPFIDEKLKEMNKTIDDVSEIEVNTGPGSFTGLRVGISIANAIGWSKGIPVNGRDIMKEGIILPKYE